MVLKAGVVNINWDPFEVGKFAIHDGTADSACDSNEHNPPDV
jgi:hypothetical protein